MEISEHSKLLVLRIVMNFVTPEELVALSATHTDLQENAASLFRKAKREFHQSDFSWPEDLNSSFDTVPVGITTKADFSNCGRYFFHIPVPYLSILSEELNLSGSLIDERGLRILSKKCTDLYSLRLQRCEQLNNNALHSLRGTLGSGFASLLCIDLSHNSFVDKQTLKILLNSGLRCIHLVGWHISAFDELEISNEYSHILHFTLIFAKNGERILELDEY